MANYPKLVYMEDNLKWRGLLFGLIIVLCLGLVSAGSWDSFDEGNGSSGVLVENSSDDSGELEAEETKSFDNLGLEDSSFDSEDSFRYTSYFYLALGICAVGLLIVVLFFYLLLKRPKNQWNGKKILK